MDDYLAKPISLARLKEVLELWFPSDMSIGASAEPPIDMNRLSELSNGDTACAMPASAATARQQ
jgi:hypothetical protein